jgi:hypothetical protein
MKRSWRCLVLAGVCALLSGGTAAAQTPSSQAPSFFRAPTFGGVAGQATSRMQRTDVIQAQRRGAATQGMMTRLGHFLWPFGQKSPNSPTILPKNPAFPRAR